MRRRVVTVLVVALVSAIGALVVRQRPGAAPEAAPATERADASPPPLSTLAPAPRPMRNAAPKSVGNPPTKGSLRVRVLADGAPAVGATVRSRGWLTSRFSPSPGETTLTADEAGFVEIDTSAMSFLLNLDDHSTHFMKPIRVVGIDATLEGWASGHAKIDLEPTTDLGEIRDVMIELRRFATIVGRVLAPDGTPIAATAQALFDEDTPAAGTRSFGDGVVASNDGRFRLSVDGEGSSLFVVARGDARPFTTPVTLVRGRVVEVGDVRLERGTSLAGKIRCGGIPAGRTNVIATWYGPGFETARPAGHGLLWVIGRRAIWSQLEIHPDAEGRFRLDGLEPGPYRLRVPTEDWGCALAPDAYAEVDRIVRAPDEGIDADADRSLFRLNISGGADVIQNSHVSVVGRDELVLYGSSDGQVGVVLRARARHRVVVRAKGYVKATFEITAAEPGGRLLESVTLAKAGRGDEFDRPAFNCLPSHLCAAILGPDGVPFAVPFRFFDASGTPVRAVGWDVRPLVEIRSADRTALSGPTFFEQLEPTQGHRYVEVGGGLLETRRIDFDGRESEPDHSPPSIVLHAR